ncbi:arsenosugar biosynthesis radical SAM protein ArsS [Crocinitomicaceae bacterium]|nr:arsenosugar biosynthesis radical SAM protein ArsS [Crocinitomicaceae bacterium]MDC0099171.1 arsenosugar biosynthesis radical SAM protein ArsS [Crocinitomicaceae bacterium]MDC1384678.1 arsenosugar biosynthesis radical SAM protein ArsS [Crocinitomicaceae bacterium]|tara:strand:+ start:8032 stop:9078 length:1047 start_codon:yes stop_codon:yes gene_type:complete
MAVLAHKSLVAQKHELSETKKQLDLIDKTGLERFQDKLKQTGLYPLPSIGIDTFQINMGKMCNQVCNHCHVDAGPDRKEVMLRDTMVICLDAIEKSNCSTVDLTGGAPEMNPDFRWFVEQLTALGKRILVRCNLTIIVANKKYHTLPEFFKKHNVEVVSSLPCYTEGNTDSQRGDGVFSQSITALKMLNEVGYGMPDSGLTLNLVFNPTGASLPGDQMQLELDYKRELKENFDIEFNSLFTITNLPISRYLQYLVASDNYEGYMEKLVNAYNPSAASEVMCRNTISIGWDGYIFDCDFNQMLDLKVAAKGQHLSDFNLKELEERNIIVNQHCYGCTAGAGSSCGGATV